MNRWTGLLSRTVPGFLAASALSALTAAQPPDDEETHSLDEIVVTGMRVTAGGAQDVKFALQFDSGENAGDDESENEDLDSHEPTLALNKPDIKPALSDQRLAAKADGDAETTPAGTGTVVALDAFRKKQ